MTPIVPIRIDPHQCERWPDGVPITADPPIVVVPFIAAHGGKAFTKRTLSSRRPYLVETEGKRRVLEAMQNQDW